MDHNINKKKVASKSFRKIVIITTVIGLIVLTTFGLSTDQRKKEDASPSAQEYSEVLGDDVMDCSFAQVCGDGYTPTPVEYNDNTSSGIYQNNPFAEDYYSTSSEKIVELYVVADNSVYNNFNDETATRDYIENVLIKQVADIYASEKVNISIGGMDVWDTPDPFTGNKVSEMLQSFTSYLENNNPDYNGNIAVLLTSRKNAGVASRAGSGICKRLNGSNRPKYERALVAGGVDPDDTVRLPDWSNGVHILAHELGHSLGSPHTQGCFWNGNNTAIDGCKETEALNNDPCSRPPVPEYNKGTIMSYCKITKCSDVGVNFSLALGPQPGNHIRKTVAFSGSNCSLPDTEVNDYSITIDHPLNSYDVNSENVYRASQNIDVTSTVDGNAYVTISAGEVNFGPGFEMTADKGKLHAYIGNYQLASSGPVMAEIIPSTTEKRLHNPHLYPNPANNLLYFNAEKQIFEWHIINSSGQQLTALSGDPENGVSVSALPRGIYFFIARFEDGSSTTEKFIKR
ncbi:M12 family metallo-peptidase [Sinomicrobium kalidii]|uniref:zinc-dependent metalloprotease n=1 Tax=Sinomicrobium kalidii TaxID=2900738 RepID=UPI001E5F2D11|nr:zinc-dependent metalloprotease [Sinomicrobium kalidii]UGU17661.1 M12 family metallo-peptidase [Sinomicrobium kalidii]